MVACVNIGVFEILASIVTLTARETGLHHPSEMSGTYMEKMFLPTRHGSVAVHTTGTLDSITDRVVSASDQSSHLRTSNAHCAAESSSRVFGAPFSNTKHTSSPKTSLRNLVKITSKLTRRSCAPNHSRLYAQSPPPKILRPTLVISKSQF